MMWLTPREQEKLLVVVAADLALKRRQRGLKLNYPEAVAVITAFVFEAARDGELVEAIMVSAAHVLKAEDVMPGVAEILKEVQVEATFPDGTKLVTVHDPLRPSPSAVKAQAPMTPGDYLLEDGDVTLNQGRVLTHIEVTHHGDRPVQVGSHYHFYEVNTALRFDRDQAYGKRLAIAAGTAVRFEPGDTKSVPLVPFAGARQVHGHRGLVNGPLAAASPTATGAKP